MKTVVNLSFLQHSHTWYIRSDGGITNCLSDKIPYKLRSKDIDQVAIMIQQTFVNVVFDIC